MVEKELNELLLEIKNLRNNKYGEQNLPILILKPASYTDSTQLYEGLLKESLRLVYMCRYDTRDYYIFFRSRKVVICCQYVFDLIQSELSLTIYDGEIHNISSYHGPTKALANYGTIGKSMMHVPGIMSYLLGWKIKPLSRVDAIFFLTGAAKLSYITKNHGLSFISDCLQYGIEADFSLDEFMESKLNICLTLDPKSRCLTFGNYNIDIQISLKAEDSSIIPNATDNLFGFTRYNVFKVLKMASAPYSEDTNIVMNSREDAETFNKGLTLHTLGKKALKCYDISNTKNHLITSNYGVSHIFYNFGEVGRSMEGLPGLIHRLYPNNLAVYTRLKNKEVLEGNISAYEIHDADVYNNLKRQEILDIKNKKENIMTTKKQKTTWCAEETEKAQTPMEKLSNSLVDLALNYEDTTIAKMKKAISESTEVMDDLKKYPWMHDSVEDITVNHLERSIETKVYNSMLNTESILNLDRAVTNTKALLTKLKRYAPKTIYSYVDLLGQVDTLINKDVKLEYAVRSVMGDAYYDHLNLTVANQDQKDAFLESIKRINANSLYGISACCSDDNPMPKPTNIADSGDRSKYSTGAVRDLKEGKGRFDLMPLHVMGNVMGAYNTDHIVDNLADFKDSGYTYYLYEALDIFIKHNYDNISIAWLELAKHFEEGAKKYGENNWQKGIPTSSYLDSAVRHYVKFKGGMKDEHHDRAFMWNIVCCLWTCIEHPKLNSYAKRRTNE